MNIMWKQIKKEHRSMKTLKRDKAPVTTALSEACQTKLKSSVTVTTFPQCVEELLLNSLDSRPDCISVRVDISQAFIQVIDNGAGITQKSMLKLGERHSSSKPLPQLLTGKSESSGIYGHRGEALASIIDLSEKVEIISRAQSAQDGESYCKVFKKGIGTLEKTDEPRPCAGTTATVYNLFHKAPVRLKHMRESQAMNEVLALVQAQAICLAGKVSISCRDEQRGKVLLNTSRIKSVKEAILEIFGGDYCTSLHTLRGRCGDIQLNGYMSTVAYPGKKIRLITLNQRVVSSNRIQQTIDSQLKGSNIAVSNDSQPDIDKAVEGRVVSKPRHYMYCLDIICDNKLYTTHTQQGKTSVEFHCWQILLNSVYKIVKKFLIRHHLHKNVAAKPDDSVVSTSIQELEKDKTGKNQPHSADKADLSTGDRTHSQPKSPNEKSKNSQFHTTSTKLSTKSPAQHTSHHLRSPGEVKISERDWRSLPHTVYWLLKHVPDQIPVYDLESETLGAYGGATQASMYAQPGSPCQASSTSHQSKQSRHSNRSLSHPSFSSTKLLHSSISSQNIQSARSESTSHGAAVRYKSGLKRRKPHHSTSFNNDENIKSVFGRKLKSHHSSPCGQIAHPVRPCTYTSSVAHRPSGINSIPNIHRRVVHSRSPRYHLEISRLKTKDRAQDYALDCQITPRQYRRENIWELGHYSDSRALKQRHFDLSPGDLRQAKISKRRSSNSPAFHPLPSYKSPIFRHVGGKRNSHSTPMKKRSIHLLQQVGDDVFTYKEQKPRIHHHLPENCKQPSPFYHQSIEQSTKKASPLLFDSLFQQCKDKTPKQDVPFFMEQPAVSRSAKKHKSAAKTFWSCFGAENTESIEFRENRETHSTHHKHESPRAARNVYWNVDAQHRDCLLVDRSNETINTDELLKRPTKFYHSTNHNQTEMNLSSGLDESIVPSTNQLLDELFGAEISPHASHHNRQKKDRHVFSSSSHINNKDTIITSEHRIMETHQKANELKESCCTKVSSNLSTLSTALSNTNQMSSIRGKFSGVDHSSFDGTDVIDCSGVSLSCSSSNSSSSICNDDDENESKFNFGKIMLLTAATAQQEHEEKVCKPLLPIAGSICKATNTVVHIGMEKIEAEIFPIIACQSIHNLSANSGRTNETPASVKSRTQMAAISEFGGECPEMYAGDLVHQDADKDTAARIDAEKPTVASCEAQNVMTEGHCMSSGQNLNLQIETADVIKPKDSILSRITASSELDGNLSLRSGWSEIAAELKVSTAASKIQTGCYSLPKQASPPKSITLDNNAKRPEPDVPQNEKFNRSTGITASKMHPSVSPQIAHSSTPTVADAARSDSPHQIQDNVVSSSQQVLLSKTTPCFEEEQTSLISSFTSEEMRHVACEESKGEICEGSDQPALFYIDSRTGNSVYQPKSTTDGKDGAIMADVGTTPAARPKFVFGRVRTPYTTPGTLPRIGNILSQAQEPGLLPFRKEVPTPLTSQKEMILTPDLLSTCNVIGQMGKQVILAAFTNNEGQEILIALDQHAAHERIRLELIEKENITVGSAVNQSAAQEGQRQQIIKSATLNKPIRVSGLRQQVYEFINNSAQCASLQRLGVHCDATTDASNSVSVTQVPAVMKQTCENNAQYLKEYVESVVTELSEREMTSVRRPRAFTDYINSVSCRGAIKFGDLLTRDQCVSIINSLSKCRLPFQCAHGRPSCVPLYNISSVNQAISGRQARENKLNFNKLKLKD